MNFIEKYCIIVNLKSIEKHLKRAIGFYLPFISSTLVGSIYFFQNVPQGTLVMWFCDHFNKSIYMLFSLITRLGEPLFILVIIFLFFYRSVGKGVVLFASWFIASMLTICLKNILETHRPPFFFKDEIISCAGNIDLLFYHSTPSGHTTAAFAFFAALSLQSRNKLLQFFCWYAAFLVGLSRIVLFTHFYLDVYLGSIIGGVFAFFIHWAFYTNNLFSFKSWKNKRIFKT